MNARITAARNALMRARLAFTASVERLNHRRWYRTLGIVLKGLSHTAIRLVFLYVVLCALILQPEGFECVILAAYCTALLLSRGLSWALRAVFRPGVYSESESFFGVVVVPVAALVVFAYAKSSGSPYAFATAAVLITWLPALWLFHHLTRTMVDAPFLPAIAAFVVGYALAVLVSVSVIVVSPTSFALYREVGSWIYSVAMMMVTLYIFFQFCRRFVRFEIAISQVYASGDRGGGHTPR